MLAVTTNPIHPPFTDTLYVNMATFSSPAPTALLTFRPHTGDFAINPVYVDVASMSVTDLDKGDIVCVNWRKLAPYSVKLAMRKPT